MSGTLEALGFYFAWDKEGRYPIDVSQPIPLDENRKATVYLTHRPIQEEDGYWYWWEIYPFERYTLRHIGFGQWFSTWARYAYEAFLYKYRNGIIVRAGAKIETMLHSTLRQCLIHSIRFMKPECSGATEVSLDNFAYLSNRVDGVSILQRSIPETIQIGSDTFVDIDEASVDFTIGSCGGIEIDWIVSKESLFACELFTIAYNDATGKIDVTVSPLIGEDIKFSTTAYIAPGDRVRCSIHWENGEVSITVGDEEYIQRGNFSFPPRYYVEQDDALNISLSGLVYHLYFVVYPRRIKDIRSSLESFESDDLWKFGKDAYRLYNESLALRYGCSRPDFNSNSSNYKRVGASLSTNPWSAKRIFFGDPLVATNYIEQGVKIDIDASGSDREEVYLWAALNGALMHFAHKMRLTKKPDGDIDVELVETRVI